VAAGDGFVAFESAKFTLERGLVGQLVPLDYFYRSERPQQAARKPNFAIATASDGPEQFVIGHARRKAAFWGGFVGHAPRLAVLNRV